MSYNTHVVKKPWGEEHLLYGNKEVAVWYLLINPDESTSLHAHPNKKTGLVLLSGLAKVSFLNGGEYVHPSDKVMIRQGVFHRTTSHYHKPIQLLEIETPVNKEDIVRLEDAYGRAGKPYEGAEHYVDTEKRVSLKRGFNMIGECTIDFVTVKNKQELLSLSQTNIMVLSGSVYFQNFNVIGPGDIVSKETLRRLAAKFDSTEMTVLGISKYDNR